jgi:cytochrome c556
MFSLRRELQAIEEYAEQGEPALLGKWSDKFAKHLRAIPEMVPEWRDAIEWDELVRLERAVTEGRLSTVSNQVDRIRRDCRNCHREYRTLAALRYRSPDFSGLTLNDDNSESIDFSSHMETLSRTLNRIKIASEDTRWASAGNSVAKLKTELERLANICATCHRDAAPRARIFGESSVAVLEEIDSAIGQQDLRQTGMALGQAAVNICARCHATHRTLSEMRQLLFD